MAKAVNQTVISCSRLFALLLLLGRTGGKKGRQQTILAARSAEIIIEIKPKGESKVKIWKKHESS